MLVRPELDQIRSLGYSFEYTWQIVDLFEKKIAKFFGAPYAIATDCCTHALELSIRLLDQPNTSIQVPLHTYMSVPMMLEKIHQPWNFVELHWQNQYQLSPLPVIDSARMWKQNSYISDTLMCLSFQFKKHIPIGRGGMILTDNLKYYNQLQKLVRDGRDRTLLWTEDDADCIGYHYYMTPEDAARGLLLFDQLRNVDPKRKWSWQDYKPLTGFSVFKNHSFV